MSQTLDRSKKYEGLGMTWKTSSSWPGSWWIGLVVVEPDEEPADGGGHRASASNKQMQAWLDAGHIKPVKKTKIVRVHDCVVELSGGQFYVCEARGRTGDIPSCTRSLPVTLEFPVEVEE